MSAFSLILGGQCLQANQNTKIQSHLNSSSSRRPPRIRIPAGPLGCNSEKKREEIKDDGSMEEEQVAKRLPWPRLFAELYGEAERLGRGLKSSLSPKQKGDWKDLVLMSFSFAVYVYISQKIVCAYCAWVYMLKH